MADPGELIGPYRLLALLGAGAMGEVWRARDERLDRQVAVKVLPADLAGDPERRARMLREARAAAAVPHAHVVTLFDVVSEDDRDALVMELVEGQTLSELLRRSGPPPLREALGWLVAVADALATAHARGILHRDLKAANLIVTPERAIKVLDFGLAKLRGDGATTAPAPAPRTTGARDAIALDATMASEPGDLSGTGGAYETRAGALLGTPIYMAPEQIEGQPADERSEVFSVGIVAYELLTGRAPYTAKTIDDLFVQIVRDPLPPWPDAVPAPVRAAVDRALAKDPAARTPTMAALRDALAAARDELFAPPSRRWPLLVAVGLGAGAAAAATWLMVRDPAVPDGPGDAQVRRALDEYDLFYGDKAASSLRAALAIAPDHPRAHAYLILFGRATAAELAEVAAAAERIAPAVRAGSKDRALLDAAVALHRGGPAAARRALEAAGAARDRELAFWAAEMAYRAGDYAAARDGFAALVGAREATLLGRIYDHYSAVLIWADDPAEAVRIGERYLAKFPGEADAVGVHATTLAIAGRLDEALAQAEQARALAEGEDTLAGLAKVHALRGELDRARALYQQAVDRAPPHRRPVRRAALGLIAWAAGDDDGARAAVAPCLPGGDDATIPQRGQCLFVAGVVDPPRAGEAIAELDALAAAASELAPAYGDPAGLARLLRVRARFAGGGCLAPPERVAPPPEPAPAGPWPHPDAEAAWTAPADFYAVYHVPFFSSWAACEHAAWLAHRGDRAAAAAVLAPVAERAPGRAWLLDDLARYRGP